MAVGGDDAIALREGGAARIVGDGAASLDDDEGTSHIVPLTDVLLGIAVETARGDIAERHRRRTAHTDARHMTVVLVDEPMDDGLVGVAVIGELQAEEGIVDVYMAHMDGTAVEPGSTASPG